MLPWLFPPIQRRIWPGLYLVRAPCKTTACGCVALCCIFGGRGVGGLWSFGVSGVAFGPVAGCLSLLGFCCSPLLLGCCAGGGGECSSS